MNLHKQSNTIKIILKTTDIRCELIFTIFGVFVEPYKSRFRRIVCDISDRNSPLVSKNKLHSIKIPRN